MTEDDYLFNNASHTIQKLNSNQSEGISPQRKIAMKGAIAVKEFISL